MARMYPPVLPRDTYSVGEQKLYRMLQEQLSDEYIVMHGVSWTVPGRSHAEIGEIDFLVIHPDLGLVILEVKDQSVLDIRSGRWQVPEGERTPPAQIDRNQRFLRQMLKRARITAGFDYEHRVSGCLVCTNLTVPDGDWLNQDLLRSQVIDMRDCDQLENAIRRVSGELPSALRLTRPAIDALKELLARNLSIRAPELLLRLRDSEQQFVELSHRQFDVLNMLQGTPRLAIPGCAGSGKTLLAIETARRLARQGLRILLTCHTRELANSIRDQVFANAGPELELITVEHFHGLASRLIGKSAFQELMREHGQEDNFWDERVPEALIDQLPEIDQRFDAIIVDEGQDFADLIWLALEELHEHPGHDIFYIFFDSNQRVFRRNVHFPVAILPLALNTNFRNTDPIHELVRSYHATPESIVGAGIDGVEPSHQPVPGVDVAPTLQRLLHRLVNENRIDPTDIVVLTPISERNPNTLFSSTTRLGNFTLTRGTTEHRTDIPVRTIHAFKGMESPVTILVELDKAHRETAAELVYVGLSRARSQLYIIGELPDPPTVERATAWRAHGMSEKPRDAAPDPPALVEPEPAPPQDLPPEPVWSGSTLGEQIALDPAQQEIVRHATHPGVSVLVTGGPGSGKSLVLIHAAAGINRELQKRSNGQARVLFTTFTNSLVRASRQQLNELLGPQYRHIETTTADKIALDMVTEVDGKPSLLSSRYQLLRLVKAARSRAYPENTNDVEERASLRSIDYLEPKAILDEIENVIIARGFETSEEYLAFNPGRLGLRLNSRQRKAIWQIARTFETLVARENKLTLPLVRRRALDLVLAGHWRDRYDSVIVDEAQDLPLSSLRMLQELCPVHGRFVVSADPNQSIYPVRIDVDRDLASSFNRRLLNTSYRSSREVMEAARRFVVASRVALPPEPDDYPRTGRLPMIRSVVTPEDETKLLSEFFGWAAGHDRRRLAQCCVLVPSTVRGQSLADELADHGIPATWMTSRSLDLRSAAIKVMTLHAAKGLEFRHVAIAGFVQDDANDHAQSSRIDGLINEYLQFKKLLYVGMTRSLENLLFIHPAGDERFTFPGITGTHWNTTPGSANPMISSATGGPSRPAPVRRSDQTPV